MTWNGIIPDGLEPLPILVPGVLLFVAGIVLVVREVRMYRRNRGKIIRRYPPHTYPLEGTGLFDEYDAHDGAESTYDDFMAWDVNDDKLYGGTD